MSEAKHTPGPWSIPRFALPDSGCKCKYVLCESYMGAVAAVHCEDGENNGDDPPIEEAKANARLIASAPDLLEACETALPHYKMAAVMGDDESKAIAEKIMAALRKARGL